MLHCDMCWLDPFTAASRGTVDTVARSVFLEFMVPPDLELHVEQFVYMLQWYMVRRTASWWHVRWVCEGQFEYPT